MVYYRLLCTFLISQNFLDFASAGQRKTRIAGSGDTRTPRGYPFVVSLEQNGQHACGGTILHEFLILTAAHCVYSSVKGYNPQYTIRAGSLNRGNGGQVVKVEEYKIHEKFKEEKEIISFDVAILKLEQPLRFEEGVVGRVQMAKGNLPVGQQATILGWGNTKENGDPSDWLRNVSVTILDQKTCSGSYSNFNTTEYAAFCAGDFENGGVDSCSGDSGGPLILESDGRQVGIVSSGEECAHPHKPGLYTNIIQTREWINRTMSKLISNLKIEKTNVKFVTMSPEPPYLVSIKFNGHHVCSGTILNEHIILTAALCLSAAKRNDVSLYTVQAGNLFGEKNSQIANIKDYEIHPKYKFGEINSYDVAILKLEMPLNFSTGSVRSVNLVDHGEFPFFKDAIAFEWHNVNKNLAAASGLRNVTLTILSQDICSLVNNYTNVTEYALFCADDFGKGAFDPCASSNGGPLILESDGTQIGIVSSGEECAHPHKPGVYTNIIQTRKWINRTMSKLISNLKIEKTNVKFVTMSPEPPYLVSIKFNGHHVCSGTILNEHIILTAALCLSAAKRNDVSLYTVQAGNLFGEKNSQIANIKDYEIHPKYKFGEINSYDVAILKLEMPLNFSTGSVRSVNLVDHGEFPFFKDAIAFEWHNVDKNLTAASGLRNVTLTILSQDICSLVNNYTNVTEYALFCADDFGKGAFDPCAGGNGGPLILEPDGRQVGIVSSGEECAHPHKPGVYTNVIQTRKWINRTMSKLISNLKIEKTNVKFVTMSPEPPYLVSIKFNGHHVCGGTILNEHIILTAALCLSAAKRNDVSLYTVQAGNLFGEKNSQIANIKDYEIHPKYKFGEINSYDVAILKLEMPLNFSTGSVRSVNLVDHGEFPFFKDAIAFEWHNVNKNLAAASGLRNVTLTILNQEICSLVNNYTNLTEYALFCADDFGKGAFDPCAGSNGGPLILESDGTQIGIVSSGEECAHPHKPVVYTNIIQTRKWINRTMSKLISNLKIEKTNVKFVTMSPEPPYLVSIKFNGHHVCSGTILNEHIILTAALCLSAAKRNDVSLYTVQAGNLFGEKNSQIANIKDYEIHPKYKFGEINSYDAAILKLEKPLNFSTGNVRSVNLVDDSKFPFFKDAIAFEWHNVNKNLAAASGLRNVTLTILNQEICILVNNYTNVTEYALFCADDFGKGAFDPCAGDNGGPLILESDGTQIGVVSVGHVCDDQSLKPRLFTNIMEIRKWINDTITKFTYHVSDKPYFHSYLKRTEFKRIDGYRGLGDYEKDFRN